MENMTVLDNARHLLNRAPRIKKHLKVVSGPIRKSLNSRAIKSYNSWLDSHLPSPTELAKQAKRAQGLPYRPLISIIVPVYNPPEDFFKAMIDSVLAQTYSNWELLLVDDASPDNSARCVVKDLARDDERIRYTFLETNKHISGASNVALGMATGEFVALLDNDDILQPNALYEVANALNKDRELDFIYSDEDKLNADTNIHTSPYFKPSWNQDFLYSVNYITHLSVIRKAVIEKVGGFDGVYDGAQDWELFFRLTQHVDATKIHHIPKILYSWRVHEASTAGGIEAKPYVIEAQRKAIESALATKNYPPHDLHQDDLYPAQWCVYFSFKGNPRVTIVTPSDAVAKAIGRSVTYDNYETVVRKPGWGYDDLLVHLRGEFVVIVDANLKEYNPMFVEAFLADAQRSDVGFVVARHIDRGFVMDNIKSLINPATFDLVAGMSMRDVTKHFIRRHAITFLISIGLRLFV